MKNQEGQAPVDLASADDARSLLQDAMASQQVVSSASAPNCRPSSIALYPIPSSSNLSNNIESVIMPSGLSVSLTPPVKGRANSSVPEGCCSNITSSEGSHDCYSMADMANFLSR